MMWNGCFTIERTLGLGPPEPLVHRLGRAFGDGPELAALHGDAPVDVPAQPALLLRRRDLVSLLDASVATIAVNLALLPMQQFVRVRHVSLVGRGADHAVDQTRLGIHARVHLHPEVPLVPVLGLVHLGVALAVLVLRGTWRGNDGGVHHRALAHQQPTLGEVRVDLGQHGRRQVVLLKQAAELQQRRGVGHVLPPKVDADELSYGMAVVQRVLQCLFGQCVPLLQEVHAQHPRHANRRSTHIAALRVALAQFEASVSR